MSIEREIAFGGKQLKVTFGKTARQADGAVWVQYGETILHLAVVSSTERIAGGDFLPLTVDYREKFYAAGKVPGGFFKREGRPHENEILNARIIDRPIRPPFPDGYAYETQVMAMVISSDQENDAAVLGPIAASIALNISDIPMNDVIASARVGYIDGNFVVNPTYAQQEESRLDLYIVGSAEALTMVEGHCDELSNQEMIDALAFGHEQIKILVEFQKSIVEEFRKPTREYELPVRDESLIEMVKEKATERLSQIATIQEKSARSTAKKLLIKELLEGIDPVDVEKVMTVQETVTDIFKQIVRRNILDHNIRLDGRSNKVIRDIECEIGVLPRVHGSSLFTRGQTQALGTVTLGTKLDEQRIDQLDVIGFQRYMLHYSFPPYCTGEIKRNFGVSRREVGHGKLGERALQPMLPPWDEFPYTIRVTSDIMESNGSSSMASVCAGSLALMDAGVPIKKAVAGIAMGLIKEGDDYKFLTDILGDEDHLGDMDFKVAGTRDGITAFQMDIKIKGISPELMAEALTQARDARHHILDKMDAVIDRPKSELSQYAPHFIIVKIPVDRIGALIGPGGKMIREIIADTGATIDVEDDGTVRIGSTDGDSGHRAKMRVEALTQVPEEGKTYTGTIKKIMNFGAFVEILPGVEGLMHISQIEHRRVENVEDLYKVGDLVEVKLLKIDPAGKLDLSRKALLPGGPPPRDDRGRDDRNRDDRPRDDRNSRKPRDGGFQGGKPPRR